MLHLEDFRTIALGLSGYVKFYDDQINSIFSADLLRYS